MAGGCIRRMKRFGGGRQDLNMMSQRTPFAYLLVPLLSVHLVFAERVTVNVAPDPKACTAVHLPKWKESAMPPGDLPWGEAMPCDIGFRSFDGGVLAGASCRPGRSKAPVYSPSKYAVYFGTGRVRKATDDEWDHADPYLNFRDSAFPDGRNTTHDLRLVFKGKELPKTGSEWPLDTMTSSRLSPARDYVAVNSWDGRIAYPEPLMFGRSDLNGHYYVDIYNVASGQRVLAISGEFHGVDPYHFFEESAWISKRYFVLPLDEGRPMRQFVICYIQRASAAEARPAVSESKAKTNSNSASPPFAIHENKLR